VLRAGTLNDERVVKKVSSNFVPTYFNNNDPTRDKNDVSRVLWESIKRQMPLQGQGLWVVAPDGTVLGGMSAEIDGHPSERAGTGPGATWKANPKFIDAVLEMLDKSLEKHGPVAPRTEKAKPLPFRGAGVRPDGGVRLIVYNRADNGLVFSVPLSREEWAAFAPPDTAARRWNIPESVARQFGPVISIHGDTRLRPRPEDVRTAELTAEAEPIDANHLINIRLSGRWQVDWRHDGTEHSVGAATVEGIAVYDAGKKQMQRLLLIFDGTYSYTSREGQPHRPQPLSVVVRWRLEGEPE
jgi:hypothetical protein